MLFLGIDGGGTKTEFCVCDENAKEIIRLTKESISHWQVSTEESKAILVSGVEEILSNISKTMSDLTSVGYGMSGLGEDSDKDKKSIEICKQVFQEIPLAIKNDGEIGLISSFGFESGINIVAGTGSIAFGKDDEGNIARCGGWGHEIGDEGSGYWLSIRMLEHFTKQADGRLEKTLLYELVKKHLQLKNDFEIMAIIQDNYFGDRTKIASLQSILSEAALKNDKYALALYEAAAMELVLLATSIEKQLKFTKKVQVSFTGGVFKTGDYMVKPFIKGLSDRGFLPKTAMFEPIQGALLVAAQQVGYGHELLKKMNTKLTV